MFDNFPYFPEQVNKYYQAALKDLNFATQEKVPEVLFYICYNFLIKIAMAVCAKNNLRVKSRIGHHTELIQKLADLLGDSEIEVVANKMRSKRNRDLYDGGISISNKEADYYFIFCQNLARQVDSYLFPDKLI